MVAPWSVPDAAPVVRPRRRPLPVLLLVLVLVGLLGLSLGWVRPASLPVATPELVPTDGYQPMVSWQLSEPGEPELRSEAMLDHARTSGLNAFGDGSLAMWNLTELPEDMAAAHWWREALVFDDLDQPRRYRTRTVDADGVRLHGQQWGARGITFGPAVLELPADPAVGDSWQGEGRAVSDPTTTQLYYRSSGRVEQPPAGSGEDCLTVSTEIRLATSPERTGDSDDVLAERGTWCPAAGMVRADGSWRGASWTFEVVPATAADVPADLLREARPGSATAAGWTLQPMTPITSDATFGDADQELISPVPPVVTDQAVLASIDQGTGSLVGSAVLPDGVLLTDYWVRVSGGEGSGGRRAATLQDPVLSLGTVGSVVLATTSARELVAYQGFGRRLWSLTLDEIATAPPVRLGPDRLGVATLAGTVYGIQASTGRVLWQHAGTEPVAGAVAGEGEGVLAADADGGLRLLGASTGEELWTLDDAGATQVAAGSGRLLSAGFSDVSLRDEQTGAERWSVATTTSVEELLVDHDVVAVRTVAGLQLHAGEDGGQLGTLAGVQAVLAVGGDWLVATEAELLLVDDATTVLQRWPLPETSVQSLQGAAGLVWLVGRRDSTVTLHRLGAP